MNPRVGLIVGVAFIALGAAMLAGLLQVPPGPNQVRLYDHAGTPTTWSASGHAAFSFTPTLAGKVTGFSVLIRQVQTGKVASVTVDVECPAGYFGGGPTSWNAPPPNGAWVTTANAGPELAIAPCSAEFAWSGFQTEVGYVGSTPAFVVWGSPVGETPPPDTPPGGNPPPIEPGPEEPTEPPGGGGGGDDWWSALCGLPAIGLALLVMGLALLVLWRR